MTAIHTSESLLQPLAQRYAIAKERFDLSFATSDWRTARPELNIVVLQDVKQDPAFDQLFPPGKIALFLAYKDDPMRKDFINALKQGTKQAMAAVANELVDRLKNAEARSGTISFDGIDHFSHLFYGGKRILDGIVLEKTLGFNLVGFSYHGGSPDHTQFELVNYQSLHCREELEVLMLVRPLEFNAVELMAQLLAPPGTAIGFRTMKPQAWFEDQYKQRIQQTENVVNKVENVVEKGIDVVEAEAKIVVQAAQVAADDIAQKAQDVLKALILAGCKATDEVKKAMVGGTAWSSVDPMTSLPGVHHFSPEKVTRTDLEYNVDELLALRSHLMVLNSRS